MNKSLLTQILNEEPSKGTICRLKSTFENLEKAKHFMDDANAVPGLIGHLQPEHIHGQLKYNVQLMLYNQFDKKQFKAFMEEFENIEIVPILPINGNDKLDTKAKTPR